MSDFLYVLAFVSTDPPYDITCFLGKDEDYVYEIEDQGIKVFETKREARDAGVPMLGFSRVVKVHPEFLDVVAR